MKKFILLITILFSQITYAQWHTQTIKDNGNSILYVGVSRYHKNLADAMSEAYNNAVKEAVKHNFGFNQQLQENFYVSMENTDVQQNSFINMKSIQINGVKPEQYKVIEKDDMFMVYRQISYDKEAIRIEKERLMSLTKEDTVLNTYNNSGAKGFLTIKTIPSGANIQITSEDGKTSISGSSNGKFNLPLGKYSVLINKKGFITETKSIIVADEKGELSLNLTPAKAELKIFTEPSDAIVMINGRKVESKYLQVMANETYKIRVEHPDFFYKEESILLEENGYRKLNFRLNPRDSKVSVFTTPNGADVYINGSNVGKSPIQNYNVPAGYTTIIVKKDDYMSERKEIYAQPNKANKPVNFSLEAMEKVMEKRKEEAERYTYNDVKTEFNSSMVVSVGKMSNPLVADNLSSIYGEYSSKDITLWNIGIRKKFEDMSWLGWEIGLDIGSSEFKTNLEENEYKDGYTAFYIGFPIYLFDDRLIIRPSYSFYSFEHEGNPTSNIYNYENNSLSISGGAFTNKTSLEVFRFSNRKGERKVGINVFHEMFQPLNTKIESDFNNFNTDNIKLNNTQTIGIGLNFYY